MKLYRHPLSGHAHRAELLLSLMKLDYTLVEVDLAASAQKRPELLAMNRFGQIPVLVDGEAIISDSNAILVYLASRYDADGQWYPGDAVARAEVQRWLSVAAGLIAFGPAVARLVTVFGRERDHKAAIERSNALLIVMESTLAGQPFLVDGALTIADIAGYTYIAHAPEGGVDLQPFPAVRAWLARIEALDGFVPMQATPAGLAG